MLGDLGFWGCIFSFYPSFTIDHLIPLFYPLTRHVKVKKETEVPNHVSMATSGACSGAGSTTNSSGITLVAHHQLSLNGPGAGIPDPVERDWEDDERIVVPSSPADWEEKKDIIGELYMTQNLILNDVIKIMYTQHHFKATCVFFFLLICFSNFFFFHNSPTSRAAADNSLDQTAPGCTRANLPSGGGASTINRVMAAIPITIAATFPRQQQQHALSSPGGPYGAAARLSPGIRNNLNRPRWLGVIAQQEGRRRRRRLLRFTV